MTTKDKILKSIRENPKTVTQLVQEFGLARTAITTHLDRLVNERLVEKGDMKAAQGAGKPAQIFKIVAGTEDAGSSAYLPFVASLLENLPNHLDKTERKKMLEKVGRHMANGAGFKDEHKSKKSLVEKIEAAIGIVNKLGATAELIDSGDEILVRNITCPLASAVRSEPCVCNAVAAFFSEATGSKTKAACERGENLICRYVIKK